MFVFFYLVIMSLTYFLAHSEGETTCDCSEIGNLQSMVRDILYDYRTVTNRLRKLEDKQSTASPSKTTSVSNDRLEILELKVEDLEVKVNNTITTTKEKQEGFGRNIGAIVKKTLNSEKKERTKLVSRMIKNIEEHKKSLETFKVAMNNTIEERFKYMTAIHNEHTHDINETFSFVLRNMSTFQEDIIVDLNGRIDKNERQNKEIIEIFKVSMNNTVDERFENITAIQNEHIHYINETFSFVLNNMSTFQENVIVEVNKRLDVIDQANKSIQLIATDLNTAQQGVSKTRDMIEALEKSVEKEKVWSTWSAWGKCSKTCEAGLRERSRTCTSQFGCIGNSKDFSICNTESCVRARLVNGSNRYEGRLEVVHDRVWGTVCDDHFDENAARVACKMLNLPSDVVSVHSGARFGQGLSPILLDDVKCNGTESSILSCSDNSLGITDCTHKEDVGISCYPARLVNGNSRYEGRLEVFYYGVWGTVCDDDFDENAARVVCKMLDFPSDGVSVYKDAYFGRGSLPILLDDVKCKGNESSISSCSHKPWYRHDCSHSEDVGISCKSVRLVNGTNSNEGRLEVFHNRVWGTVCDDDFDENAARVVCRMLHFPSDEISVHIEAHFGQGSLPTLLDDVKCKGTETNISSCSYNTNPKCSHNKDVGISCQSVRLVNGANKYEGRLEVFHNGKWGTVCEDFFDENAARVVCKMLYLPSAVPGVYPKAYFGRGSLPILLDDVKCDGTESSIFSCSHRSWGKHNCGHYKDVGILCSSVRLVNGSNRYEGRLEVLLNGVWGTVCDEEFDENAARVVCKMLHYPSDDLSVHYEAHFGQGSLPILVDDVKCNGSETSLSFCSHNTNPSCSHNDDIGISCQSDVRLVNGSNRYEGRLEVFYNGVWGTVCDDYFDKYDASVVCRMLNHHSAAQVVYKGAHFGRGSLPILLGGVYCYGFESSIFFCPHRLWGEHNCDHGKDVGILCSSGEK